MTPNNPMTEGEALAVDVGALHDAAKFLAGRYSDHDGWVVAIRAAASALTAHTAASAGEAVGEVTVRDGWDADKASNRLVTFYGDLPPVGTKLYTAPPAAVPADALERLVEKWREEVGSREGGPTAASVHECADELAALIPKGADHG